MRWTMGNDSTAVENRHGRALTLGHHAAEAAQHAAAAAALRWRGRRCTCTTQKPLSRRCSSTRARQLAHHRTLPEGWKCMVSSHQ